jgi:hypothetical protein
MVDPSEGNILGRVDTGREKIVDGEHGMLGHYSYLHSGRCRGRLANGEPQSYRLILVRYIRRRNVGLGQVGVQRWLYGLYRRTRMHRMKKLTGMVKEVGRLGEVRWEEIVGRLSILARESSEWT